MLGKWHRFFLGEKNHIFPNVIIGTAFLSYSLMKRRRHFSVVQRFPHTGDKWRKESASILRPTTSRQSPTEALRKPQQRMFQWGDNYIFPFNYQLTTMRSGPTKGIWWSSIKRRPPRVPRVPGAQYRVFPSSPHWRWCHPSQAAPGWAEKTNKEAGVCRERKRFIFLF